MSVEITLSHMCKSARALGLSKNKQHLLEDYFAPMLRNNGREFVIQRLKKHAEINESRLLGNEPDWTGSWIRNNGERASGPEAALYFRKPMTGIRICNAMASAITLDNLTNRQLDKWTAGVRKPEKVEYKANVIKPSKKTLHLLDRKIAKAVADNGIFQPIDITGTSIPIMNSSIRVPIRNEHDGAKKDLNVLLQAYQSTINSAPAFAGQAEIDLIEAVETNHPDLEIKDKDLRLTLAHHIKEKGQDRLIEYWDRTSFPYQTLRFGMNQQVGHLAFLQQPQGKLRAIANPNRYVQHTMRPLQKALSSLDRNRVVSATFDQEEGKAWVQRKLREGHTMVSMDLTSATDTLDFDQFLEEHQFYDESRPVLSAACEQFRFGAKALWYSPDLNDHVNWHQGQPLGLAPSFQILTLMNVTAGYEACTLAGASRTDSFRVVGDDFVCVEEIADAYVDRITSMGGSLNLEKSMRSSKMAEFCSTYITPHMMVSKKPHIRGEYVSRVSDLEKAGYSAYLRGVLPVSEKDAHELEIAAQWHSKDLKNLPQIPGSDKLLPLSQRSSAALALRVKHHIEAAVPEDRTIFVPLSARYASMSAVSEEVQNSMNRVPDFYQDLADSSFLMSISSEVRVYDWKRDEYLKKENPFKSLKRFNDQVKSLDLSDPDVISGFSLPYHDEKVELNLLYDKRDNIVYSYATVDGKDCDLDLVLDAFDEKTRSVLDNFSALPKKKFKGTRVEKTRPPSDASYPEYYLDYSDIVSVEDSNRAVRYMMEYRKAKEKEEEEELDHSKPLLRTDPPPSSPERKSEPVLSDKTDKKDQSVSPPYSNRFDMDPDLSWDSYQQYATRVAKADDNVLRQEGFLPTRKPQSSIPSSKRRTKGIDLDL